MTMRKSLLMTGVALFSTMLVAATVHAAPSDDASAADVERMQGDWMVTSMRIGGEEYPAVEAQALFRTVEGDQYSVSRYTKVISRGKFVLDATQTPKTIDSTPMAVDPSKGDKPPAPLIRGIYEFDGKQLRICNARPGQPRPKDFSAKQFTGHTLIVWEPEMT
jgi:uncharacterized protein (TIGR03067 family)